MFHLSRRRFVISAAVASAAFGLDKQLEFLPAANAQGATPKFAKFKVGNIEVTQVFDGVTERQHDPAFIRNASIEDTKKALKAAGLSDAVVAVPYTVTVVRMNGKYVMFDSGNAPQGTPTTGLLRDNMKAAGIDAGQINTIIVTHFHPDHIFGLMTKENAQLYDKIDIIVPAAEYKSWTDTAVTSKLPEARQGLAKRIQATFPGWKNIKQFSGDKDVLPGIRPVASYGHTLGHTSYLVSSGNNQFMVLGDVTNIPALFVRNPGWHAAFDQEPQMAEATRRKMFDRVVADKLTITGYHYGMPGAGRIGKDGNSYVYTPMKV